MKTPSSSLFYLLSVIFLVISRVSSSTHNNRDDFLDCLQYDDSISNSEVIYTQNDTVYESILQSLASNLRAFESSLKPQVILTPVHESQIQTAIYCAQKHDLHIRVRGGGHDYEGLSYISEIPFVLIDLRNFRSISIDIEEKTAWVEGGATLGELYYTIAQESRTLAFAAGSCPTVGVGGHISGGGFSMMSRKFGLAADNVVDAKIIDVNGRILDRKSMGEDLFWAIRGGGAASFGVIIAWKVKLLTVPENVTVFTIRRTLEQNATQLVYRWQYIADRIDENLLIRLFIRSVNSSLTGKRTVEVSFASLFVGGTDDLLKIMQNDFPELGLAKEDCIEMSWIDSIRYFSLAPRDASIDDILLIKNFVSNYHYKGKSDYVIHPISENGLLGLWEMLHEEDDQLTDQLQFTPYGGRLADISESETPFPYRAGNIYMIHYMVIWTTEQNSEASKRLSWIKRLYSYMTPYVSKSPRRAYMNYRDLDLGVNNIDNTSYNQASNWGFKYFGNNFKRLVDVKTKVDPTNFFRNEQSIPSLLPEIGASDI